jgi:hypothetical protein
MLPRGEALVVLLQGEDDARHVVDRIDAKMRLRTVRRPAAHADAPAQHTFARNDGTQTSRLRHDGGMSGKTFAKLHHATIRILFVHHGREPDFARRLDVLFMQ